MTLKVLVAGRSGQVARSLVEAARERGDIELVAAGRPDLDITSEESVKRRIEAIRPDVVINAAAYTAVDQAEDDREAAFAANEAGPRLLARSAATYGTPIIHLSTDYVFDGEAGTPYSEDDEVAPLGVYGQSKLAGERAVAETNPKHLILRTAWVYGAYGKNFLKTMLRVARERDALRVVADQRGAPTSSHDIAEAVLDLCPKMLIEPVPFGTYHLAARGEAVWADFAEAIFRASDANDGPVASIERITTEEYPTPAKRPAYSVLDSRKLEETFGIALPHWSEPVPSIVGRVLEQED